MVYSAKILGTPLKGRVAGFDFACDMLDVLDEMGGRLYLLGAKPGVAEEAGRRILETHPNIVLCGTHDGYFQDSDPVAREVAQAQPDLLFVCLGAPKQEKWIARFGLLTGAKLAIGLGGALDVFAGNVERAPGAVAEGGHGVGLPPEEGAQAHRPHGQAPPGAGEGGRRGRGRKRRGGAVMAGS